MNRFLLRLFAVGLGAGLSVLAAQSPPPAKENAAKPAAEKKAADKKPSAGPFHGKLAGLDKHAKTITVGKRTFQITSKTKINKGGKPATLDEGVVGDEVSGYVKPTDDGKLVATKINLGPKAETKSAKSSEKKKD